MLSALPPSTTCCVFVSVDAPADSALSKPHKTRPATALRCRRSYRAKATVLRVAKDSSVCSAKANAPLRPPPSERRVLCAGDLLQIIKGCSVKPARAARHGYIILDLSPSAQQVVKCNNARSRNMSAATRRTANSALSKHAACHPEWSDRRERNRRILRGYNRVMI